MPVSQKPQTIDGHTFTQVDDDHVMIAFTAFDCCGKSYDTEVKLPLRVAKAFGLWALCITNKPAGGGNAPHA